MKLTYDEMPVGIDKSLISELVFKVDSQRFDTI